MKQQLLKFFALFVCVFLFGTLNAQVTINYEQEGAGEPELEYLSNSWTQTYVKLTPGEILISDIKYNWKQGVQQAAYELLIRPNADKKLKAVYINGVENADYLKTGIENNLFTHYILEGGAQTVSIKIVYEGEYVEKQWTQKVNTTVIGFGAVKCTYEDKTKGEQTVTLENKKEAELDVKPGEDGKYRMRITGEPENGKVVRFITVNGKDVKDEYDANGYYDIVVETEKATTNLIVEFGDAPRADMIVNYAVSGNGTTDYYYFSDAESTDKMEGTFASGENMFDEMYFSAKYTLYVVPKPENGYLLGEVRVNGKSDASKKEQFESNGYFTLETAVAGEEVLLTISYVSEVQNKNTVTVKANPDVNYLIRYSNVSAGKQEFYEIKDKDVVIELPDNAFCSWDYTRNPDFVVRGLVINGTPLGKDVSTFIVNSDMTIELDYVPTANYSVIVSDYSNGTVSLEKKEFSIDKGDYVYVPLSEGEEILAGTGVRVTAYADPGYEIKEFKVNGELKLASTPENSEYEYSYVADIWENLDIDVTFELMPSGIDAVSGEPVVMNVYSVEGILVKTCIAASVDEAVEGLGNGLYIVNGKKVIVSKSVK